MAVDPQPAPDGDLSPEEIGAIEASLRDGFARIDPGSALELISTAIAGILCGDGVGVARKGGTCGPQHRGATSRTAYGA